MSLFLILNMFQDFLSASVVDFEHIFIWQEILVFTPDSVILYISWTDLGHWLAWDSQIF